MITHSLVKLRADSTLHSKVNLRYFFLETANKRPVVSAQNGCKEQAQKAECRRCVGHKFGQIQAQQITQEYVCCYDEAFSTCLYLRSAEVLFSIPLSSSVREFHSPSHLLCSQFRRVQALPSFPVGFSRSKRGPVQRQLMWAPSHSTTCVPVQGVTVQRSRCSKGTEA